MWQHNKPIHIAKYIKEHHVHLYHVRIHVNRASLYWVETYTT